MIDALISSKTRIKLLLKFFLNSDMQGYLRGLESEFGESSNAIRLELNRFEKAGLLTSFLVGNKKFFTANTDHPLFNEIHRIVIKHVGFDKIIDTIIKNLGDLQEVYVTGELAHGRNSKIVDVVFVGVIEHSYLLQLLERTEKLINKKIRYLVLKDKTDLDQIEGSKLLLWHEKDSDSEG